MLTKFSNLVYVCYEMKKAGNCWCYLLMSSGQYERVKDSVLGVNTSVFYTNHLFGPNLNKI